MKLSDFSEALSIQFEYEKKDASDRRRAFWTSRQITECRVCRVPLEVDQPSGSTYLLEADQATGSSYPWAYKSCEHCHSVCQSWSVCPYTYKHYPLCFTVSPSLANSVVPCWPHGRFVTMEILGSIPAAAIFSRELAVLICRRPDFESMNSELLKVLIG